MTMMPAFQKSLEESAILAGSQKGQSTFHKIFIRVTGYLMHAVRAYPFAVIVFAHLLHAAFKQVSG